MARVNVQPHRKIVDVTQNIAQTRSVLEWNADLTPKEWTPWKMAYLAERVAWFSGKSSVQKSDFIHPTNVVLLTGGSYEGTDSGTFYSWSTFFGQLSQETKSDSFAVLDSNRLSSVAEDPRNLTWNIGGNLTLARYFTQYNEMAWRVRKKMAEPIVDLGLIGAEALRTAKAFESIALDLLHVLKFVKHGDVLGAVKVAFGNNNVNAIFNRDLGPVRRRIKNSHGTQYMYIGRNGKARSAAQLRAMHPAKRWLEYSFGVAPVIQDVHEVVTLKTGSYPVPDFRYASGVNDLRVDEYTIAQLRMVVKATLSDPYARYRQQIGTHATQIYALAYELIPLSWLLDYVCDIGGMLTMLSSSVGLRYDSACWSVKLTCTDAPVQYGSLHGSGGTTYSNKMSYKFYERNLIDSFPTPAHPRILKVLGNGKQQANLFAFLTMAFSGHIDKRITNLG